MPNIDYDKVLLNTHHLYLSSPCNIIAIATKEFCLNKL